MSLKEEAYRTKRTIDSRIAKAERYRRVIENDGATISRRKKKVSSGSKKSNANSGYSPGEIGEVVEESLVKEIKSAGGVGPQEAFGPGGLNSADASRISQSIAAGLSRIAQKRATARTRVIK